MDSSSLHVYIHFMLASIVRSGGGDEDDVPCMYGVQSSFLCM